MSPARIDIVTLFPGMFAGWLENGGVSRAKERGLVSVELIGLREFGIGRHLQVDDYPFGGGAGMVLKPEPLFAAVESIPLAREGPIVLMSPRGHRFNHRMAEELAEHERLTLIAGHYEGVDERVSEHLVTHEISIGDYVLSGGELGGDGGSRRGMPASARSHRRTVDGRGVLQFRPPRISPVHAPGAIQRMGRTGGTSFGQSCQDSRMATGTGRGPHP